MREPTELEKKHYQRMIELSDLARKRYLESGGNPRRCPNGFKNDDYLTKKEREEFFALGRKVFNLKIQGNEAQCQGHSWKILVKEV